MAFILGPVIALAIVGLFVICDGLADHLRDREDDLRYEAFHEGFEAGIAHATGINDVCECDGCEEERRRYDKREWN